MSVWVYQITFCILASVASILSKLAQMGCSLLKFICPGIVKSLIRIQSFQRIHFHFCNC